MIKMQSYSRGLRGLCGLLGYTRQAYYQYQRGLSTRCLKEDLLIQEVLEQRRIQPRVGTRKLMVLLQPFMTAHQVSIGRDVFFELLRVNGLLIRRRRRQRPRTTFSAHDLKKYPNQAKDLIVKSPEKLWVSDITYIHLSYGFAYLSLVTDVYSHKIVGYYLSNYLTATGCVNALSMAIKGRTMPHTLMHHSDRGSQYCSTDYIKMLNEHHIEISMTESGDPRDNAIAERVNGILKQELLKETYPGFKEAQESVSAAIDVYNNRRPHSSVDMLTPKQAHTKSGELRRRWKNYYKATAREVYMDG